MKKMIFCIIVITVIFTGCKAKENIIEIQSSESDISFDSQSNQPSAESKIGYDPNDKAYIPIAVKKVNSDGSSFIGILGAVKNKKFYETDGFLYNGLPIKETPFGDVNVKTQLIQPGTVLRIFNRDVMVGTMTCESVYLYKDEYDE